MASVCSCCVLHHNIPLYAPLDIPRDIRCYHQSHQVSRGRGDLQKGCPEMVHFGNRRAIFRPLGSGIDRFRPLFDPFLDPFLRVPDRGSTPCAPTNVLLDIQRGVKVDIGIMVLTTSHHKIPSGRGPPKGGLEMDPFWTHPG